MTGRTSIILRRSLGARVHLRGLEAQRGRTRCGKLQPRVGPAFRVADRERDVTCRMCLRCDDADHGKSLTR